MHRSVPEDRLSEVGIAEGTADALTFGPRMADMIPWAYNEVRSQGVTWGTTYILEVVSVKYSPGVRYVQDKAPLYYESGGGYGFFYVAELLLNFGYWGGIAGACFLGIALQAIALTKAKLVRATGLPALLGASFALVRNDFMTTLKVPLYIVASCLLLDAIACHMNHLGKILYASYGVRRAEGPAGVTLVAKVAHPW